MAYIDPSKSPPFWWVLLPLWLFLGPHTVAAQSDSIIYDLTFVGDAGTTAVTELDSMIKATRSKYSPSAVIFLGDNIYPHGLPDVGHAGRNSAEEILLREIAVAQTYDQTFFIPGNHDWKKGMHEGLKHVLNQQAFIDSLKLENIQFPLRDGCPGPEELPIGENIVLVFIDTQWFLHSWDKPEGDKSPCEVKTPADVTIHLDDILNRNQGKRVIVMGHHPVYTYGPHGGIFTLNDHLFPLTAIQKDLYLPLPIIGSLMPMYRKIFGDVQDIAHPLNKALRRGLHDIMKQYPQTIYVSGHEHALQEIEADSLHYVVSGSGGKSSHVELKGNAKFVSSERGFVKLLVLKNGTVRITYYSAHRPLHSRTFPPVKFAKEELIKSNPLDTLWVTSQASLRYQATGLRRDLLGANYREEWNAKVTAPALDIGLEQGGLEIVRRGGGMETMTLRLKDSTGREFSLRTIEKFPTRALRPAVQKTFIESVVQDQVSAEHPYGALAAAALASAAGIYHTNPKLVYAPSDLRWGTYRKDFAGQMMLFEERPEGHAANRPYFGNPSRIMSTHKLLEHMRKDHDVQVDQKFVLRSRIFDMWIGDWDRHDDQWRWGEVHHGKVKTYRPIPRDRDQAFFVNQGFVPHQWRKRRFRPFLEGFDSNIRWVPGLMEIGRWFDATFLNSLTEKDFIDAAQELQRISGVQIDSALRRLPPEVYPMHGIWISQKLKDRQRILPKNAAEYYRFLSRNVDVTGSDKAEWFEGIWKPNGNLELKMFNKNKEGQPGKLLYEREFMKHETKEVRLYGFGGEDMFKFTGNSQTGIKLRVIGGGGKDQVIEESQGASRLYLYDLQGDVVVQGKVHDRTSKDPMVNDYNRKGYEYNRFVPKNAITYNIDDGVYLIGGFTATANGFRKKPYKSYHLLQARYAVRTYSFAVRYAGRFPDFIGKLDLELDGDLRSPNYVVNFFGWGNESGFDQSINDKLDVNQAIDYYRLRFRDLRLEVKLNKKLGALGYFKFGPSFQRGEVVDPGPNHFVYEYNQTLTESILAKPSSFVGGLYTLGIDKRDNIHYPTRGIYAYQTSKWMHGIETPGFSSYSARITLYQSFRLPAILTYAFNAAVGHNVGSYQLFQSQTLDGNTDVRGYRETRFYGDTKVFFNNELRMKLGNLHTYLFPASFGIHAFYDVGRVWYRDGNGIDPTNITGVSNTWHPSYGGGVWLKPYELTTLVAEIGHSNESTLVYLRLGFLF